MIEVDALVRANILIEALPYVQEYANRIVVVKYGGNAMINEDLKQAVIQDVVLLNLLGIHVVLVHGGGPEISDMLKKTGKESKFKNGLRITDDETKLEYLPSTASLNGIVGIGLNRSDEFGYKPATGTLRAESRAVTMQLEINDVASRELGYFYVVQNDTEHSVPTTEQIVNYIKYQTSPNQAILDTKFDLGGFDKNRLGTGLFDGENTGGSFTQELILSGSNTFLTGQKLYFVTMDKYGNIVGSAISPNSTGLTGGLNHAKITE